MVAQTLESIVDRLSPSLTERQVLREVRRLLVPRAQPSSSIAEQSDRLHRMIRAFKGRMEAAALRRHRYNQEQRDGTEK